MAVTTPAPRIGKFAPPRKKPAEPANSEKLAPNARFHVASEMAQMPKKRGLINRMSA